MGWFSYKKEASPLCLRSGQAFVFLLLMHTSECVGVAVAGVVANPVPVGIIAASVTEYCRAHSVVAAIVHRQSDAPPPLR